MVLIFSNNKLLTELNELNTNKKDSMKKLSMLITESISPISVAQTLMIEFGKGYNSEWRVFLNKVLEG